MSFHIGQRVVCVNGRFSDRPDWRRAVVIYPELNAIYTIRDIVFDGPLIGFHFCEFANPRANFPGGLLEPAFNTRNFRPVKTTSIDVFTKMLAPADLTPVG